MTSAFITPRAGPEKRADCAHENERRSGAAARINRKAQTHTDATGTFTDVLKLTRHGRNNELSVCTTVCSTGLLSHTRKSLVRQPRVVGDEAYLWMLERISQTRGAIAVSQIDQNH